MMGTAIARESSFHCSIRSTMQAPALEYIATKSSLMWYVRRIFRRAARRPWRMDLVYRIGRLDVPDRNGGILGIHLHGNTLAIDPCIPRKWTGFEFTYKHGSSRYQISVANPGGVCAGHWRLAR